MSKQNTNFIYLKTAFMAFKDKKICTNLESSGTPVDELDGSLGLDGGDSSVNILGDHVTTVQHTAGHVLAVTGVALHHLIGRFEASVSDLGNSQLLMVCFFGYKENIKQNAVQKFTNGKKIKMSKEDISWLTAEIKSYQVNINQF